MKNISHKKCCISRAVEIHLYPPRVPVIKINLDMKSNKYYVKIKFYRNTTSGKSDMYDFIMSLIGDGDPEGVIIFKKN